MPVGPYPFRTARRRHGHRVHRIGDRVFYEIPKDKLGREFLWVSQIARTTLGAGYGGQSAGNRVVYRNGVPIGISTVSTGREGYRTPTGIFCASASSRTKRRVARVGTPAVSTRMQFAEASML